MPVYKEVRVIQHPVAENFIRILRDAGTNAGHFRRALRGLGLFLAMEATAFLPAEKVKVVTPLGVEAEALHIDSSKILLVPILRAGLGFVDSFLELLPNARVAHIGISRDHDTLQARSYVSALPGKEHRPLHTFILDPMLATGNSSVEALKILTARGIPSHTVTLVCGFAVKEGIQNVFNHFPAVNIVTAAIDPVLNEKGYIVPGLGDAGDRQFLF